MGRGYDMLMVGTRLIGGTSRDGDAALVGQLNSSGFSYGRVVAPRHAHRSGLRVRLGTGWQVVSGVAADEGRLC